MLPVALIAPFDLDCRFFKFLSGGPGLNPLDSWQPNRRVVNTEQTEQRSEAFLIRLAHLCRCSTFPARVGHRRVLKRLKGYPKILKMLIFRPICTVSSATIHISNGWKVDTHTHTHTHFFV